MALLESTSIWLLFSFVLFMFVLFRMGKKAFVGMLDSRIESIKQDLETAESLRVEAQELLAQYQRKHRNALKESEEIIAQAQIRADEVRANAERDLKDLMARRERQLAERLQRMEQSAIDKIRQYASDLAIKATAEIIEKKLGKKDQTALIDDAIKRLPQTLN